LDDEVSGISINSCVRQKQPLNRLIAAIDRDFFRPERSGRALHAIDELPVGQFRGFFAPQRSILYGICLGRIAYVFPLSGFLATAVPVP
jgi:hypothetical protein